MKHEKKKISYFYGPVFSWRLGSSLGIDPVSTARKTCTFDCVYCQLGNRRATTKKRKVFVPVRKIISEFKALQPLLSKDKIINYITFSGMGEPTLAGNLGRTIAKLKSITGIPIAVLSNSSLINNQKVRRELKKADYVVLKLDAPDERLFEKINRPGKRVKFKNIFTGLKKFSREYKGKFALQIMFVKENKNSAKRLARLVREIKPDEVQINTPLRPCAARPLSREEIKAVKKYFKGMRMRAVYDASRKKARALSKTATLKRRPSVKN